MTTIAQSSDPVAALKLAHRATWAAGDYPAVARPIADGPVTDALTAAHVRHFLVSKLHGMLPATANGDPLKRTAADNQTVRNGS